MSSFLKHGKKIVAIGRNYVDHVKELDNTVPKEPFFFLKPTSSYFRRGKFKIPRGILVHHEVELGVVIGKPGRDIPQSKAESHIAGYVLAVDMTARNLQEVVKKQGLPWSAAKGFDTFTPVGHFIPKTFIPDPHDMELLLMVNGTVKQQASTSNMIFRIPRLINHISSIMTLEEGDVVLTGTPSGVGPVVPGDTVECCLTDLVTGNQLSSLNFEAVQRKGGYVFQPE